MSISYKNLVFTGDGIEKIRDYKLIYYLYAKDLGDKKSIRILYKYQYYMTNFEKSTNPEWAKFTIQMNNLYKEYLN
ncbi:hypothetical protein GCM10022323_14300 [Asaccharospora irregularis DSM 2635]